MIDGTPWLQGELYRFALLPLLIFLARIGDMSLGTTRIILVARGRKYAAAAFGFAEVLIWLFAISQVIGNVNNPLTFFAYAAGFSAGTIVGVTLEEKIAIGKVMLRTISGRELAGLLEELKGRGFGYTVSAGEGPHGAVKILSMVIQRKDLAPLTALLQKHNPSPFYWLEDVRASKEGMFPEGQSPRWRGYLSRLFPLGK